MEQGFIEEGHQGLERGRSFPLQGGKNGGGLFPAFPAKLLAHSRLGFENRRSMKPPGQRLYPAKARRFARQRDEHVLRDFLRHAGIAHLTQRRREDQADVPRDQSAKGGLRAFGRVRGHQLAI